MSWSCSCAAGAGSGGSSVLHRRGCAGALWLWHDLKAQESAETSRPARDSNIAIAMAAAAWGVMSPSPADAAAQAQAVP